MHDISSESTSLSLWTKKIGIIIVYALIAYISYSMGGVIFILVISGFLTLLFSGVVDTWEKRRIPAWLTLTVIYIMATLAIILIVSTVLPIFVEYITKWVNSLIVWINSLQSSISTGGVRSLGLNPYIERGLDFVIGRVQLESVLTMVKDNAGTIQTFITTQVSSITSGGISIIGNVGSALTEAIFIAIMTFLMVLERRSVGKLILDIAPERVRTYMIRHYADVGHILTSWIRGQIRLGVIIFSVVLIWLYVIELVFDVSSGRIWILALIAGIMEFIPYIGPIIAVVPALVVGLGFSWEMGLTILIFYIILQQIENNVLVPWVMSKSLDLSPLYVFVMMLAGGVLGGVLGIILAIPVAAVIRLMTLDWIKNREKIDNTSEINTIKKVLRKSPVQK
jgi:predicted PurR-regulated permease PerM